MSTEKAPLVTKRGLYLVIVQLGEELFLHHTQVIHSFNYAV
jgi:hypothetical protein